MGTAQRAAPTQWMGRKVGGVVLAERLRTRRHLIAVWVGIVVAAALGILL